MGWWGGGERAATGEAACVCACARVSVCVCVCVCVCLVSGLFWLKLALLGFGLVLAMICVAWFRVCFG